MFYSSKIYMSRATKNFEWVGNVQYKAKVLRSLKVDLVLKMYATFYSSLDLCGLSLTRWHSIASLVTILFINSPNSWIYVVLSLTRWHSTASLVPILFKNSPNSWIYVV